MTLENKVTFHFFPLVHHVQRDIHKTLWNERVKKKGQDLHNKKHTRSNFDFLNQ